MAAPERVDFVENKSAPAAELARMMRPAIERNHHTNFGPVCEALENTLQSLNGGAACCATANATLALQAAVAVFENTLGRPLRWAVSDFGFFTSFIGPFHNQRLIPCDPGGMIFIPALEQVPHAEYDAILATNVFGLHEDFTALFDFARCHGKALLIDNAAGFRALAPIHVTTAAEETSLLWAEVASFHHTKPWGMGEGGAIFLPTALKRTARSAINFGVGDGRQLADIRWCTNGKLSDLAAAQILWRAQTRDRWVPGFRDQAARILGLGRAAGLQPLIAELPQRVVPGQIPFLCDRPVPLADLENPLFRILKYYRPALESGATAHAIFDRILNVPCHSGMAMLKDDEIRSVLTSIRKGG